MRRLWECKDWSKYIDTNRRTGIRQRFDAGVDKEKDILDLYFYKNKTQAEIGKIIGKTQTSVSGDIRRILRKIKKSCETLDNTLIM